MERTTLTLVQSLPGISRWFEVEKRELVSVNTIDKKKKNYLEDIKSYTAVTHKGDLDSYVHMDIKFHKEMAQILGNV